MREYIPRYIEENVVSDLKQKMVFIGGPRQTGKTTLAKHILESMYSGDRKSRYLNWDSIEDREAILRESFPGGSGPLVLDEIHKYADWRRTVKGLFDKRGEELSIIVTGSARLDYYRRGGDSLQGRYHFWRLAPFSLAELKSSSSGTLNDLLHFGGFPEPFLLASESEARRWSREFRTRIIREDLRDLQAVHDLDKIELLSLRLPELVGSPLSLNALREDLQVSHQSVDRWIGMLENLYALFRVHPFGAPRIKAVKKEAKHYMFDWTTVRDRGARFENLVACHLLKWCWLREDTEGRQVELRYFRDIDRREVDFVVVEDGVPVVFVECKSSESETSRSLKYLKGKFPAVRAEQVSLDGTRDYATAEGIRVRPAAAMLAELV
jgi:predicted AAA+ superfamily ATPase